MPSKKGPARVEPRFKGTVDIDEAHKEVGDVLSVWRGVAQWEDAPPFSGGVFDSWPARTAAGLAFLRAESRAVLSYLMHLENNHRG